MTKEVKLIEITNNRSGGITIKIPRFYLRHAAVTHPDFPNGTRVTNTKIFSDAVVYELRREREDGATPVHLLLDGSILRAVEWGAEGIKLGDEK